MRSMFNWIASIIEKKPIKTLLVAIFIFAIMVSGAIRIRMATGSNTLVKDTSTVYKSNLAMEENFGGDSIIVLFEGDTQQDILSIENIKNMRKIEHALKQDEGVFSTIYSSRRFRYMDR